MSGLPEGWGKYALEEVSSLITKGTTPTTMGFNYEKTGVSFVKIENIANNRIQKSSINQFISEDAHAALLRSQLQENDVLFSIAGTIGKTALVKKEDLPANTNQAVAIIRVPREITSYSFLQYQLSSLSRGFLADISRGGAMNNVSLGDIKNFDLRIPPLAEQIRIAQKLDELLAQVDTLKARIDAIPALLKRFRQSVLAAAVSGRLTEEWRVKDSMWSDTTIGEVCSVATGKTPKRDTPGYWENGDIPWLTSALTGSEFCSEAEQFVTAFAVKDCTLKVFQPGTLLMAMYGEGKTRGQVTELKIAATCNQACAAIVINESIATKAFVKIRLQENYEEIRKQAVGGAQPNLNLNKVRELTIRLPSLLEQTEIVRRVEQLFAFTDQLEAKIKTAQARVNHLTQSILAKAFRGELVPQDPNDEPASVLLERIKTQRAAAPKAKRGRKAAV